MDKLKGALRVRNRVNGEFTNPMPRAKFVDKLDNPYYLIRKSDLIKLKEER